MSTEPTQEPLTVAGALAVSRGILAESREVIDSLFGLLETINADLAKGRIVDAQAKILATLEAAPDFRATSAVRRLLGDVGGHA